MKIGILYNATNYTLLKTERDFSLLSEISKIKKAFEENKHEVILIEEISHLFSLLYNNKLDIDLIFNRIFWTRSDHKIDPISILNYYQIPYISNPVKSFILCADKYITKLLAISQNILTPRYIYESKTKPESIDYDHIKTQLGSPFILKANGTSGSMGIRKVTSFEEFNTALRDLKSKWNNGILFEEYIDEIDITVPVISHNGVSFPLEPVKYNDQNGKDITYFTREIKYFEDISCVRLDSNNEIIQNLKRYATVIHEATECTIISRSDFKLTPDHKIYFLECNAAPDLNPYGAFVVGASGDITYTSLLQHLIDESIRK